MDFSRRDFIGIAATAVAAGTSATTRAAQLPPDDPLQCRQDFPILQEWTYLNSPYIAPSPQVVVDGISHVNGANLVVDGGMSV